MARDLTISDPPLPTFKRQPKGFRPQNVHRTFPRIGLSFGHGLA